MRTPGHIGVAGSTAPRRAPTAEYAEAESATMSDPEASPSTWSMLWRVGLYTSGRRRAKHLGTFGVSVYSALGAESLHPLSPLTSTLNYGPIQPDGRVAVRIIYDHRVMDGSTVARALACLQDVLSGEMLAELRGAAGRHAA